MTPRFLYIYTIKASSEIIIYDQENKYSILDTSTSSDCLILSLSLLCSINGFDKVNRQPLVDLSDSLGQTATISNETPPDEADALHTL